MVRKLDDLSFLEQATSEVQKTEQQQENNKQKQAIAFCECGCENPIPLGDLVEGDVDECPVVEEVKANRQGAENAAKSSSGSQSQRGKVWSPKRFLPGHAAGLGVAKAKATAAAASSSGAKKP